MDRLTWHSLSQVPQQRDKIYFARVDHLPINNLILSDTLEIKRDKETVGVKPIDPPDSQASQYARPESLCRLRCHA